jgi:hypothetical protein
MEPSQLASNSREPSLFAFELLPFPETLDVKVIAKEPELDPVDAIAEFDETEIGLGREAPETPEAPETVVDSEGLMTRLIDQLPDRLGVSLVIERMRSVVVEEGCPVELVKLQLGMWTSVP